MSLMDALLLDEYHDPHDSYVAARSDRLLGSGSLSDPWDAGVVTGAAQPVGTLSFDVKDVVVITAGVNPYNTSDQVQITIEVGPQAPPYTQTFVVTRLSSRAFKFSLSADPVSPPSALCRFTSAPSGPGTPPKMTVRLFWPVAKVMAVAHGVVEFDVLTIANASQPEFMGDFVAVGIGSDQFHYQLLARPGSTSGGSATFAKRHYRFDAAMGQMPANGRVEMGPTPPSTPIRTRGLCSAYVADPNNLESLYVGFSVKSGQQLLGSGIETTFVKVEFAADNLTPIAAFGSFSKLTGFQAWGFTVDAALGDQPVPYGTYFAPVASGALGPIRGSHNRLRWVRSINFGTQAYPECFVVSLHGFDFNSQNLVISDCILEKPWNNSFHETTLIVVSTPTGTLTGDGAGSVIRRCYVDCRYATGFTPRWVPSSSVDASPGPSGRFTVNTLAPHNRSAGQNLALRGIGNASVPSVPHPFNSSFRITQVFSTVSLECEFVFPPSPFPTPSVSGLSFLGIEYHGPHAMGGTGCVTEAISNFDCTIPFYKDTAVSRDAVARDNYSSDCTYGVWMNFGTGGLDDYAKGASIAQVSGDPLLAEFTVAAGTVHGLSPGNIVSILGALTGPTHTPNNPYNGEFLVESTSSHTTFRYRMTADSGGPADAPTVANPIQYAGRWDTRRLDIERNLFDVYSVSLYSGMFPRGVLGDGELVASPFLFNKWTLRENLIRHPNGQPSSSNISVGIRIKGINGLLAQENLIDLEASNPIQQLSSVNFACFNNMTMSGKLVPGHTVTSPDVVTQKDGELAIWVDEAMTMALI